jgi:RsiW-degrading membrane proteinase PrsW (M82 family)
MNKNLFSAGVVGLLVGLFVFEYFIAGIPVVMSLSAVMIIAGYLDKKDAQPLPVIQIPHAASCSSCGQPIHPGHKFCNNCGTAIAPAYNAPSMQAQTPQPTVTLGGNVSTLGNVGRAFANLALERSPLTQVSNTVYETLDPVGILGSMKLILVSVALFIGFYALFWGGQAYSIINTNLVYFVASYSVAIVYLVIIYRSDKYEKEPFKFVLFVFVWGVFCGVIAAPLNDLIGPLFQASLGNAALIAPFTEEPLKAVGLYYLLTRKQFRDEFNTPLDGIVYGFAAGMGFFAMENFLYFLDPQIGGESLLIMRSLLVWGHGVWVATTGLWLAIAKVQRGYLVKTDLLPGLSVAIMLHFLWNGWPGFVDSGLVNIAIGLQFVFHFWYMRKIIREALRDEDLWGYGRGMAPVE